MRRDTSLIAYVKYDKSGYVVPGSLILRKRAPKRGNWVPLDADQCCPSTTTTTTTTEA